MKANFLIGLIVFFFTTAEAFFDISLINTVSFEKSVDIIQQMGIPLIFILFLCKLGPIICITIYEILKGKSSNLLLNFKQTSIYKSRNSGGIPYADLYYYSFHAISSKITFITTALTLGIYGFIDKFKDFLYSVLEPFKNLDLSNYQIAFITVVVILLIDFLSYFKHFLSHRVGFLWDLHEFHHSPNDMTILSNFRNSPLSNALQDLAILPLIFLSGLLTTISLKSGLILPAVLFIIWNSFSVWVDVFGHSSVKMLFPRQIETFLMSPALHWIHHSSEIIHYDCNFGQKFAIWDKLFGTYYSKEGIKELKGYGVKGTEYNKFNPLLVYFWIPFKKIFYRLRIS